MEGRAHPESAQGRVGAAGVSPTPLSHSTHYEAGCPRIEEQQSTDKEGAHQQDADCQEEAPPQPQILLPEEEGGAAGVGMYSCLACLRACRPGPLDGFYEVCSLLESVQQEGELGKLQGLGCWDCGGDRDRGRVKGRMDREGGGGSGPCG